MLTIEFKGWFSCRLATDPDPSDELRGVSGWTYAVAGEPDLDRIIRFHDAPAARTPGPDIGVNVTSVAIDGQERPAHPLLGGRVDLLDDALFEGRNGLISEDGREPMLPFHLSISGGGLTISRLDPLDPQDRPLWEIDPPLFRRQFAAPDQTRPTDQEILAAAGLTNVIAHQTDRKRDLNAALATATQAGDEVAVVALTQRLASLRQMNLRMFIAYGFSIGALGGTGVVAGNADPGATLDLVTPWPFRAWLSAYDGDALCGFVRGRVEIPTS
jgi:hypothetical protein